MAWSKYLVSLLSVTLFVSRLAVGLPPAITGAQTGISAGGPVPIRRDLNQFFESGDQQWDLYIQSLQEMYTMSSDNPLSFYQMSGVHGMPYTYWRGDSDAIFNDSRGYCPHADPTFIPWHRPYMMLFEQELVRHAIGIATRYPANVRGAYVRAAETLRLPYWDWMLDSDLPRAVVDEMVTIRVPEFNNLTGQSLRLVQARVSNPLNNYRLPTVPDGNGGFQTIPRPRLSVQRCAGANAGLRSADLRYKVMDTVLVTSRQDTFEDWAGELESAHNQVHYYATCGGTFQDVKVAAFDPLFLLHHTNVDRIAALAQAIYPRMAVQASPRALGPNQGLFTRSANEEVSADSPLRPFWNQNGVRYTSRGVADLDGLGYSYEGLEYWRLSSTELQRSASRLVTTLYANNDQAPRSRLERRAGRPGQFAGIEGMSYRIKVTLERAEVPKPCTIHVWVGEHQAGTSAVLGMPESGIIRMRVPLNKAIGSNPLRTPHLSALDMGQTIGQNLSVEIRQADGTIVSLDHVPSLALELEAMEINMPDSEDQMPWFVNKNRVHIDPKTLVRVPT